jgi:hypothetical protein
MSAPKVPRTKLTLTSGRVVYVYGQGPWEGLTAAEVLTAERESAGHYDAATNLVEFTEPASMQDGRSAPGVMLK